MKINIYITIFFFAGVLFFSNCTTSQNEVADSNVTDEVISSEEIVISAEQFNSSEFTLGQLEQKSIDQTINAAGIIEVPEKNKAVVSSYIGGTVGPMNLIIGQWVSKGQTLFTLTNPDLIQIQREFLEIKGTLDYLKNEYIRQKALSDENISAKKDFLKAEAELNRAEVNLSALSEKLALIGISPDQVSNSNLTSQLKVLAPIGGYVEVINVVQGSFLNATETAIEIMDTRHMHLELHVLESDFAKLKLEQKVVFKNQSNAAKTYEASVHLINKMLDENHFVNVHCHIEDSALKELAPGMYIDSYIISDQKTAMTLPKDAVVSIDNNHFVLLLRDTNNDKYTFDKKLVKVGDTNDDYIEITNAKDLPQDGQYLIKGAYNIAI
jgi:cobalt-zinc-cadmium efflux system membrane fusion protein